MTPFLIIHSAGAAEQTVPARAPVEAPVETSVEARVKKKQQQGRRARLDGTGCTLGEAADCVASLCARQDPRLPICSSNAVFAMLAIQV